MRGIHRWPVNSPHKGSVMPKTLPFDDVIMVRVSLYKVPVIWEVFACYYVIIIWAGCLINEVGLLCRESDLQWTSVIIACITIDELMQFDAYPLKGLTKYFDGELFDRLFERTMFLVNSLWTNDAIWRQISGSTLAQVMACCLTAPSHHLNQCWLIISEVQWHSY